MELERLRRLAREGDEDARRELCDWTLRHTPGPWVVSYIGDNGYIDSTHRAWVARWLARDFGGLVEPLK